MRSVAAFFVVTAFASVAFAAPTKDQCVDADTRGQTLRQAGRLQEARYVLAICANPSCPPVVRSDCLTRIDEVERATPSITIDATTAKGETIDVAITVDDAPRTPQNGELKLDPGAHRFVFTAKGYAPVTREVVLREGEKARSVSVRVGENVPSVLVVRESPSWMRPTGIVTFAVGLAGLGLGTGLGIASYGAWGSVKHECLEAATCDTPRATSDRASALDFATGADIAFVCGGVLAAFGALLFLLAPSAHVTPVVGLGSVGLTGRF